MTVATAVEYLKEAAEGNRNVATPRKSMKCQHLRWALCGFQMAGGTGGLCDCTCQLRGVGGAWLRLPES